VSRAVPVPGRPRPRQATPTVRPARNDPERPGTGAGRVGQAPSVVGSGSIGVSPVVGATAGSCATSSC